MFQGQARQRLSGAGVWDREEAGMQVGCSACNKNREGCLGWKMNLIRIPGL